MWPHLDRRPIGKIAIIHGKAIMMFKNWNHVLRSRSFEKPYPGFWIVVFRCEHGNEILVAEFNGWPVGGNVVPVFLGIHDVHLSRVLLAAKCRNRVKTPVDENAELGILVPVGNLIARQRLPLGSKRTI